jgi:3D (Asp-Asp-Asp) domain-containing protein
MPIGSTLHVDPAGRHRRVTSVFHRACLIGICAWLLAACAGLPGGQERSALVTATAFNSLPRQTDRRPDIGAWGDRITPGMKAVAVSADLVDEGLERGVRVRIEGLPGEYVVLDRMPAKWSRRIDIYMGTDAAAARAWGQRKVWVFWTAGSAAPGKLF